ncbi:superoxide dismutase family protein [Gordonia sp. LSe1-13]|uniref:Superoxide dismutase [Cu-Zn] n=1 Tax=Gordonia sesuvii TaxID=3116777 RepID=A0ABU7MAN0_9ACTN|nr:superoxide dismutase family protein [Gordonia sp. LSe1-13]
MTARTNRIRRTLAVLASAGIAGAALAGCSPDEEPTDAPGTTPSVVTGNQAPPGEVDDADGIGPSPEEEATADLIDDQGETVGEAMFMPSGSSVQVTVRLNADSGIPAGFHGMHIHENGVCETEGDSAFTSAGGHLQVDGNTGHPASGDLVNVNVLEDGTAETVTTTDWVTLEQIVGKSIIIHERPSNFANIPTRYAPAPDEETMSTGDAGSRIACGVIEAQE